MPEPASPLDRQDPVGPPLTFDRTEGRIQHRFLRAHGTAAHVALTSGVAPRIIIAFPAGNRGVLLQGRIHNADVALDFDGPLTPLDEETHGIQGVAVTIITDAPELRFAPAVLGNIRTILDVGYGARLIPRLRRYSIAVTGTASDRALSIERPGLDGRHAYAIQVEPRDGTTVTVDPDGGFTLHPPPTGQVCADIVATCDDPHLTPIPVDRLLRASARARLTGTDAWSWDAPFVHTAKKYAESQDASLIWEGHKAGRDIGYCHIEKLHNLEVLPPSGFYISCFPHKIRGASAGWTRAVAIFDDVLFQI